MHFTKTCDRLQAIIEKLSLEKENAKEIKVSAITPFRVRGLHPSILPSLHPSFPTLPNLPLPSPPLLSHIPLQPLPLD